MEINESKSSWKLLESAGSIPTHQSASSIRNIGNGRHCCLPHFRKEEMINVTFAGYLGTTYCTLNEIKSDGGMEVFIMN